MKIESIRIALNYDKRLDRQAQNAEALEKINSRLSALATKFCIRVVNVETDYDCHGTAVALNAYYTTGAITPVEMQIEVQKREQARIDSFMEIVKLLRMFGIILISTKYDRDFNDDDKYNLHHLQHILKDAVWYSSDSELSASTIEELRTIDTNSKAF